MVFRSRRSRTFKRTGGRKRTSRFQRRRTRPTFRKRKGFRKVTVSKGTIGWTDRYICKLKYVEDVHFVDLALGLPKYYQFRGNSLHDPDLTGLGHQPYGYDQVTNLWGSWRVLGSKINILIWDEDPKSVQTYAPSMIVAIPKSDQTVMAAPPDVNSAKEYKYARYGYITKGAKSKNITSYMASHKICGMTKKEYAQSGWTTGSFKNPPMQWYWHLTGGSVIPGILFDLRAQITITYYCVFFSRQVPFYSKLSTQEVTDQNAVADPYGTYQGNDTNVEGDLPDTPEFVGEAIDAT